MKPSILTKPISSPIVLDGFDKGRLFEEYIISLFNQLHFKLDNWRKAERMHATALPPDWKNPDLELIFSKRKKHHFAVECKWRKEFKDGKIKWADEDQIKTYCDFERQRGIPVFVAIGIGGHPSNPEKLFVTPLRNIRIYSEVYESNLKTYERKTTNRFFLDTVQLKLF